MSGVGEISRLVSIAEPQVRVWTNVGEAHLGFFASVDDIALAKQEILEGADSRRRVRRQRRRPARHRAGRRLCRPGRHVRRGRSGRRDDRRASSRAASTARRRRCRCAATCTRSRPGCSAAPTSPTSPPRPPWRCVAGLPADEIVAGVADLVPASHRGEVVRAPGGWVVIDDAYNSSPSALTRALQTLASVPGRHVAMLGEMLELGDFSARYHAECGKAAARTRRRR